MKTCRKCKIEYKEDYNYCPKCGVPYDINKKSVITPTTLNGSKMPLLQKIVDILLYIVGITIIVFCIISMKNNFKLSIFGIIFALSILPIFYKLITNKTNSLKADEWVKNARFIIPGLIFIIGGLIISNNEVESNDSNNSIPVEKKEQQEKELERNIDESGDTEEPQEDEIHDVTSAEEYYVLEYNLPGKYGKLVEYEGEKEYFYYFPKGNYIVELTRIIGSNCFLWIDYNKGTKTSHGTTYSNKKKLQFIAIGEKKEISLTNDVHIYNSNNCDYKLIKGK